jgi:hypothetical protein
MKTQDSFAFLIDNIFDGSEAASRTGIDCAIANSKENQEIPDNLRVKTVNGCQSEYHFDNPIPRFFKSPSWTLYFIA